MSLWVLIEMLMIPVSDVIVVFRILSERIMSLWVLIEMSDQITHRIIVVSDVLCRQNYEPVGSDRDVMIPNLMLLLFSEYCRENYEPVGSDRDVNDS